MQESNMNMSIVVKPHTLVPTILNDFTIFNTGNIYLQQVYSACFHLVLQLQPV